MTVTTGRTGDDDTRRQQLALLAELRDVEHWRRLVTARLDLAVAAVAALDEPAARRLPALPAGHCTPPPGLRDLLGLPAAGACDARARSEASLLPRLRAVQRDLDAYAHALRATTHAATHELLTRLDDHGPLPERAHRAPARPDPAGAVAGLAPVLPLRRRHRRTPDAGPVGVA